MVIGKRSRSCAISCCFVYQVFCSSCSVKVLLFSKWTTATAFWNVTNASFTQRTSSSSFCSVKQRKQNFLKLLLSNHRKIHFTELKRCGKDMSEVFSIADKFSGFNRKYYGRGTFYCWNITLNLVAIKSLLFSYC